MSTEIFRPSETYEQALDRAARMWGIEPEYRDTWDKRHVTPPEVKQAILGALNIPTGSRDELDGAMEERLWQEWSRLLPELVVMSASDWARGIPLHLPAELDQAEIGIEIRWESGALQRQRLQAGDLKQTGCAELRGAAFLRKAVPLPRDLPLGYHQVMVWASPGHGQPWRSSMRLIVGPDRAWAPEELRDGRRAGLALSLYGLRSARNWGCGDFTDLEGVVDWLAEQAGASFIGLNPLHAIPNRQPFNISPYLPASTFYKNPIYLDPDRIEDFGDSARARRYFARPEVRAELEALRSAELVEYERVWALKLRALKLAFAAFLFREYRHQTSRARDFDAYLAREGELLDRYATWCALDEHIHARRPHCWVWPDWPAAYRDPDSEATRAFAKKHWRQVMFHKYAQWQIDLQLGRAQQYARRRLSIGLFHDLALATDRCGSDLWGWRPFYVSGCRVGAPPDNFSPLGQDWAFPPPNSAHHHQTGYWLFAESIRKNCRHGGALRMDHVMRLFRLYWIPEGMDPTRGAYVREPYEELLRILALESVRQSVLIVGEDLGTVTPEIRQALDRFGLFGYKVPYFEKNQQGEFRPPQQYAAQAVVTSSTHDLPTLAGFWCARDIEARYQAGLLPDAAHRQALAERARDKQKLLEALCALRLLPEWFPRRAELVAELTGELHNALVGWLATAPSRLMVLNQEDLIKETEQQNLPATTSEYPNWRRKMRYTLEQLSNHHAACEYVTMFRHWLERSGRLNSVRAHGD